MGSKAINNKNKQMKKIFYLIGLLFTASIVSATFISCGAIGGGGQSIAATPEEGMIINGVRWATRNVDAPGTFAATPESAGMFFQWNRRQGWAAIGDVRRWDSSMPSGNTWERVNDPCPLGWRVPTVAELDRLLNASGVWTTRNGVDGMLFGTAPNQIFLPAVGQRSSSNGTLFHVGVRGFYWSSTQPGGVGAMFLWFSSDDIEVFSLWRNVGKSVRCVAITP